MPDINDLQRRFQTLLSDMMRDGPEQEVDQALSDMEAFVADAMSIARDGGALPAETAEFWAQTAETLKAQVLIQRQGDALMAELAIAGDTPDPELLAKLSAYSEAMTATMPDYTPDVLPEPAQALFDAIDAGDADAVRTAAVALDLSEGHGTYGKTPLYHAITAIDVSVAIPHLLLDLGADPRLGLDGDCTPLHGLAFKRFDAAEEPELHRLVQRMVDGGADLEARTEQFGWTPVQSAVSEWEPQALRALLAAGAQVEPTYTARSPGCVSGPSTLDEANTAPELLRVLLDYGADPHRLDENGQTVVDRTLTSAESYRAHVNGIRARGKTPDKNDLSVMESYETSIAILRAAPKRN